MHVALARPLRAGGQPLPTPRANPRRLGRGLGLPKAVGLMRPRILFVSESVTTAQVVRLVKLASSLDPYEYEVHFASGRFADLAFAGTQFARHQLETLCPARIERLLESGRRIYDRRTLRRYFEADVALLRRVKPALCIGDFRWTLATSAATLGIPSATLVNAYWSPFAVRPEGWPLPDHCMVRLLGERLAARHFSSTLPVAMRYFAGPLNALRRSLALAPLDSLPEVLCHGDYTLYADHPWLAPVQDAPDSHRFLGVVDWEPQVDMPAIRGDVAHPLVYLTLGSSGKAEALQPLVEALGELPVRVLVATAGRSFLRGPPANFTVASFVPGGRAAEAARLVISNGGSTTGYQALSRGVPVLGVPSNLDQFLATQAIARAGAGVSVNARSARPDRLRDSIVAALCSAELKSGAARACAILGGLNSRATFRRFVAEVTRAPAKPRQCAIERG